LKLNVFIVADAIYLHTVSVFASNGQESNGLKVWRKKVYYTARAQIRM